ncbi:glycoside hydrolase family 5 protein [Mucilaginibacter defluvii]|uniref:Glycoside hydrolase family 5 domain-containing protein n=1 Tax=Mucilaginibacter defluvii TaxID=1196019 RepID=A0ABP9FVY6_9SPHI
MKKLYIILSSLILSACVYTLFAENSGGKNSFNIIDKPIVKAPPGTPVAIHGQLHVSGRYLKNQQGDNAMLRGQSYGWSNFWPQFWNADVVNWMTTDFKVDVLRAAMGVEFSGGYVKGNRAAQVKLVKTVVDAAIKNGIYVIIDFHAHDIHTTEAKEFFTEMAKTYAGYPNIIYELYNEPDHETWDDVKAYSIEIIKTIRKYDAHNVILVGNPKWDQSIKTVAKSPITGFNNIMYTVHFYAASHGKWLRDDCTYALNKGIPIFVSECNGTEATGSGRIDYKEWQAWFTYLEKNQISWINWSISDKRNELCSIIQPGASAKGGWPVSQLTETGAYIRERLREYSTR